MARVQTTAGRRWRALLKRKPKSIFVCRAVVLRSERLEQLEALAVKLQQVVKYQR